MARTGAVSRVSSAQAPADAKQATQSQPQETRQLELGKPIERELAGGQSHSYQVTLSAGQYINVVVEQRGIDVVVALFAPDGKKLFEVNSPNGLQGPEPLDWIAETAGVYRLEVRSSRKDVKPGRYEARLFELRPATAGDRAQFEKAQALAEARLLNNERARLVNAGQYDKALPLAERALAIREKALGAEHPDTATAVNSLANLYLRKGDYAQAEPLYRRALAAREKALGAEHPDTASTLNNLATFYSATGDLNQAVTLQSRANAISEHNLLLNLATGSERQKLAYLATLSGQTDQAISLHVHSAADNPTALILASTTILQRKGRALDATSDSIGALRRRLSPQGQSLLDKWKNATAQLARLVLGEPQRTTPAERQKQIKAFEEQKEKLEADISRHSAEFRAQSQPITLDAVRSVIPADTALIEFAVYRPFNTRFSKPDEQYGKPRYVAYVLRRQGDPGWVELGEAKTIDETAGALRRALRDERRSDVKRLARALDEMVMRPVRALLGETRHVLLSPDSALNLVPFAALVDERGKYLIERYSFSYLASGRDLLRLQAPVPAKQEPLIVAGPDFGNPAAATAAREFKHETGSAAHAFSKFSFRPLPGAAGEGAALRMLLPGSKLLTGSQATKAALQQISGPKILYIATHGFFLEDLKVAATGATGESAAMNVENPLLRSGLALAGANNRTEKEEGILTALEVANLDLWGTKLVALSACDTGVGEVKNGDGVYGLRRALTLAGAESSLMSLWPVSDRGTRELMVAYYKGLQRGEGRGEALRQVQLRMLRQKARRHPYYWASFIQSGEWGNLAGERQSAGVRMK
jgi:CHAT domain-containing protein